MALIHFDGFDWAGSDSALVKRYLEVSTYSGGNYKWVVSSNGRNSTRGVYSDNGGGVHSGYIAIATPYSSTFVIGAAIYPTTFVSSTRAIFTLMDWGNAQCSLHVDTNGRLLVRRGATTDIATGTNGDLVVNQWQYVEWKVYIANSGGTTTVRVNGANKINATSLDTQGTSFQGATAFHLGGAANNSNAVAAYVDDLYVLDNTGGTHNDFLGDVRVSTLYPSANSSPLQWTGAYTDIDDATYNGADYISGATTGHRSQFAVQNLAVSPHSINAVQVTAIAGRTYNGTKNLKVYGKSSASESLSSTLAVASGFDVAFTHILPTNPNGGGSWTKSAVDAMEIGVEVV
jgi:hypothetical protein